VLGSIIVSNPLSVKLLFIQTVVAFVTPPPPQYMQAATPYTNPPWLSPPPPPLSLCCSLLGESSQLLAVAIAPDSWSPVSALTPEQYTVAAISEVWTDQGFVRIDSQARPGYRMRFVVSADSVGCSVCEREQAAQGAAALLYPHYVANSAQLVWNSNGFVT